MKDMNGSQEEFWMGLMGWRFSLVPKFHLGTSPVPREILFRADSTQYYRVEIGNGIASASAFPNGVWERGNRGKSQGSFDGVAVLRAAPRVGSGGHEF